MSFLPVVLVPRLRRCGALGVAAGAALLASAASAAPVRDAGRILYNGGQSSLAGLFAVQAKPSYQIGQAVSFTLTSKRPGNVYLFAVSPGGEVALLFPAGAPGAPSWASIRSGVPLKVPSPAVRGVMTATAPAGVNRLLLVATNAPLPMDKLSSGVSASGLLKLRGQGVGWLQSTLAGLLAERHDSSWWATTVSWKAVPAPSVAPVTTSGPGYWQSTFSTAKSLTQLRDQYVGQLRAQGFVISQEQRGDQALAVSFSRRQQGVSTMAALQVQLLAGGKARVTILYR